MPSTSKAQHNLMAMVAHDPAAAKRLGIPQKVGKEFTAADKGRKFSKGGDMKESKAMMKKEIGFMKAKGAPKSMIKHEMAEAGMKRGGSVAPSKMGKVKTAAPSRDGAVRQAHTKGKVIKMAGSSKGMMRGGKC